MDINKIKNDNGEQLEKCEKASIINVSLRLDERYIKLDVNCIRQGG